MSQRRKIKAEDLFCPFISKTLKQRIEKKWDDVEKLKGKSLTRDEYMDLAVLEQRQAMKECLSGME